MPYAAHRIQGEPELVRGAWLEITRLGHPLDVEKGCMFYPYGGDEYYFVEKGRFREDFISGSGKLRSLLIFEKGSLINLPNAAQNAPALEPYNALDESRIWRLEYSRTIERPEKAPMLARLCLRQLSSSALTYRAALTLLDLDDFKKRFCRYLLLNIRRFGGAAFRLGLTQDECAQTLGVHRATLARAIKDLKQDGVIKCFTKECVRISDAEKLRALCAF